MCILDFTRFTRVYFIITYTELLTCNKYLVPRVLYLEDGTSRTGAEELAMIVPPDISSSAK